jgi:hypothetical protein
MSKKEGKKPLTPFREGYQPEPYGGDKPGSGPNAPKPPQGGSGTEPTPPPASGEQGGGTSDGNENSST